MTPDELVKKLQAADPDGLRSVILYGSAVAGDHVAKRSDYNVLVICESLGVKELKAFSKPSKAWVKEGNPPPLFFTMDRLRKSVDVFPIELLDMKESHRSLFGADALQEMEVHPQNLRLQLEHELKAKLIQLRERFVLTGGKPKDVGELMVQSLSTFLVLFRAALRLFQQEVPALKLEAARALSEHINFDVQLFESIEEIKEGRRSPGQGDVDSLFERYLETIESVTDAIDLRIYGRANV